jgi:hypothetical protein
MEQAMSRYLFNRASGEIRRARRMVGSVRPNDARGFVGRIGQHQVVAQTAIDAFREVAARAMGFPSLSALRQRNSEVRANNRQRRAAQWFRNLAPRAQQPNSTMSPEALIEALQRGAIECGETPLTADQIRASWRIGQWPELK